MKDVLEMINATIEPGQTHTDLSIYPRTLQYGQIQWWRQVIKQKACSVSLRSLLMHIDRAQQQQLSVYSTAGEGIRSIKQMSDVMTGSDSVLSLVENNSSLSISPDHRRRADGK